jgi:Spy/CpxP family protein refolding chaperone
MRRAGFALFLAIVLIAPGLSGADEAKPTTTTPSKAKGFLPQYWKDLGLTDDQKQQVYTIQNKYNDEIDKLEAQIKDLKAKIAKERLEVLTADQKKKLEEVVKAKVGGGGK